MPIGVIINASVVVIGGIAGAMAGDKISDSFKDNLNTVFGACAMAMGIGSIVLMENMPAVIFAVIAGTSVGLVIHLGEWINKAGAMMQKGISAVLGAGGRTGKDKPGPGERTGRSGRAGKPNGTDAAGKAGDSDAVLVTALVLFCASGTGIYGSIVAGMTGDHSILLAKSILDFATALIFACTLGIVVSLIALPQFLIFMALYLLAGVIYPLCTPAMINDFKACGGILLLATGFRMIKVKEFPVADMIPAMVLAMPVSYLWTSFIMPLMG